MNKNSKRVALAAATAVVAALAILYTITMKMVPARLFQPTSLPRKQTISNATKWIDRLPLSALSAERPLDCTVISTHTGVWVGADKLSEIPVGKEPPFVPYTAIRCIIHGGNE